MTGVGDGIVSATSNNLCDNWLICPHVLVAPQTSLSYTCMGSLADSMAVVAITGNGDTLVLNDDLYTQASTEERHIDLTPFAGSVIRLDLYFAGYGIFLRTR